MDDLAWNFSAVDEREIVACCFWEYARESKTMHEAVKTARVAFAGQGRSVKPKPGRLSARQAFRESADRAFGLLPQTGFPVNFWTGLPFPDPWQRLDETERKKWAGFCPDKFADTVKFPAFQVTSNLKTALALAVEAESLHKSLMAIHQRLAEIDRGAGSPADVDEAGKLRAKLADNSPLIIQGVGGVDSFIVQINWAQFTKPEIKACFGKWVDSYACPLAKPGERGHKDTAWRARLERLGLLRLRRAQTADETIQTIAKTLPKNQRLSEKFNTPGILNSEAKKAGEDFPLMFPFLACEILDCTLIN